MLSVLVVSDFHAVHPRVEHKRHFPARGSDSISLGDDISTKYSVYQKTYNSALTPATDVQPSGIIKQVPPNRLCIMC